MGVKGSLFALHSPEPWCETNSECLKNPPLRPRRSIFNGAFIAANQEERADNVIEAEGKWDQMEHVRADIRDFK